MAPPRLATDNPARPVSPCSLHSLFAEPNLNPSSSVRPCRYHSPHLLVVLQGPPAFCLSRSCPSPLPHKGPSSGAPVYNSPHKKEPKRLSHFPPPWRQRAARLALLPSLPHSPRAAETGAAPQSSHQADPSSPQQPNSFPPPSSERKPKARPKHTITTPTPPPHLILLCSGAHTQPSAPSPSSLSPPHPSPWPRSFAPCPPPRPPALLHSSCPPVGIVTTPAPPGPPLTETPCPSFLLRGGGCAAAPLLHAPRRELPRGAPFFCSAASFWVAWRRTPRPPILSCPLCCRRAEQEFQTPRLLSFSRLAPTTPPPPPPDERPPHNGSTTSVQ